MTNTFTRLHERVKRGAFMTLHRLPLTLMLFVFFNLTHASLKAFADPSEDFTCYARFEHVDIVNADCGKNNGKLVVDPNVNAGTKMPYRVKFKYNGRWYWAGPFTSWGDSYIKNLPAGTYRNVTLVDAKNCRYNAGHFEIKENCANQCTAKFEHVNVRNADCGEANGKIIVDPHINSGTRLPFQVIMTYGGRQYTFGPFRDNKDYYIKNLPAGMYRNVTLIDANGCEDNAGDFEIRSEGGLKDGGHIEETQYGCAPFDPVPFIGSVCAPNYQVEYQWQIKRDINGYWENIAGAIHKDYDPGDHPVGSVWYRRAARMVDCGNWAYSNSVDVHVEGPCVIDCTVDLGPDQELCEGPITISPNINGELSGCNDCADRNLNGMMYLGTYDGNEYYKRVGGDIRYDEALAFAKNRGGSLPIIRNAGLNNWLAQQVGDRFWLGLTDTHREGTFKWNDGTILTYSNWNNNEPNDWGSGEDYVEMLPNGKWNDLGDHHIRWVVVCYSVCDPNSGQATYEWTGPSNFKSNELEVEVKKPGEYCLTITDCNGTVCTDCIKITDATLKDGGKISKTQKNCGGFDPAPFIGDALSHPSGDPVLYQWQIKVDKNTGSWTDIPGATAKDYDAPYQESGSVWYRRSATLDNACGKVVYSNGVDIHVKAPPVVEVVPTNPDCEGGNGAITLTFGDNSSRTNIEFELRKNGAVLKAFNQHNSKDNAGSYTIDGLDVGTYQLYTRWGNDECEVDLGTVTLEEERNELTNGGKISKTQKNCGGFDPAPFIGDALSHPSGDPVLYQWQIKVDKNTGSWTDIPGATAKDYDAPYQESGSVWYRRSATLDNACGKVVYSNGVDIHVKAPPVVEVVPTNPDCEGGNGAITLTFGDNSSRTNIEFELRKNGAVLKAFNQHNSKDNAGSYTIDGLDVGTYQLYTRWGNDECEVDLGTVTLEEERNELTNGGKISKTQKNCGGFDPAPFIGDALSHPSGDPVLYQWQIKVDKNTGSWTDIPGATAKDYDAPYQESGSVWYRRSATLDNACGKVVYSKGVDIHVKAPPVVEVTPTNPTCVGNNGAFMFSFEDIAKRTNIEFELRQNGNVVKGFNQHNSKDNAGTYTIHELAAGTYHLYTRWGNDECEVDLGEFSLTEPENDILVSIDGDQGICESPEEAVTLTVSVPDDIIVENYSWSTGANTASITVQPAVTTQYSVVITDNKGCTGEATFVLEVYGNIKDGGAIGGNQSSCGPIDAAPLTNVTLPDNGDSDRDLDYIWLKTNDLKADATPGSTNWRDYENWKQIPGSTDPMSLDPGELTETTHFLRCVRRSGCSFYTGESNVVSVEVFEQPTVEATGNQVICQAYDIFAELSASSNGGTGTVTYEWSNGMSGAIISVQPSETTTYVVTGTDENGCSATAEVTVEVYENIKDGGAIGGNQSSCGPIDAAPLTNVTLPDNGDSDRGLEYIWLKTNDLKADATPGSTNWRDYENWKQIPGSTDPMSLDRDQRIRCH